MAYQIIVNNCNSLTLHVELDQCCDQMTWKFMGYGESGLVKRIVGKPGATKGGQVTIVTDASRCCPRAYIHCHNLHHRPTGFGAQGLNEVRMIAAMISTMISRDLQGAPSLGSGQLLLRVLRVRNHGTLAASDLLPP
ncbi:unnamed protein product [Cylindrotheca closterium]|uniref:Uncharacterized protein n=1 Tax=Cylindrotheca closterium TaxID=2856 RepID=A0AAD2CRF9_9STRA|nr:unnamed protein product [Cylindrotheca closterium]